VPSAFWETGGGWREPGCIFVRSLTSSARRASAAALPAVHQLCQRQAGQGKQPFRRTQPVPHVEASERRGRKGIDTVSDCCFFRQREHVQCHCPCAQPSPLRPARCSRVPLGCSEAPGLCLPTASLLAILTSDPPTHTCICAYLRSPKQLNF